MSKISRFNYKGIATLLVLLVLLTVVIVANIILILFSSQFRLTHHSVSRARAYYSAQAAINYTLEMIRINAWAPDPSLQYTYSLCSSGCTVNDPDMPYRVDVTIDPVGSGIGNTRQISAVADYTYTPP